MCNYDKIPEDLKRIPQWCLWKFGTDKKGRKTKLPFSVDGRTAKTNDDKTFSTFDDALNEYVLSDYKGLGLLISGSVGCIDLDHVIDESTGELSTVANDIITSIDSYSEFSPSGNGLHLWFTVENGYTFDTGKYYVHNDVMELYIAGMTKRFMTVTGVPLPGYENKPLRLMSPEELQALLDKYMIRPVKKEFIEPVSIVKLEDKQILEKAMKSPKFAALYKGEWQNNYESHSSADSALCMFLAFWTCKNIEQMDRLFRSSALYREKWDSMRGETTYGQMTLEAAAAACDNVYQPEQYSGQNELTPEESFEMVTGHAYDEDGVIDEEPKTLEEKIREAAEMMRPTGLIADKRGTLLNNINNELYVLENDELLKNIRGYNEFRYRFEVSGPMPWNSHRDHNGRLLPEWTEADDDGLTLYNSRKYGIPENGGGQKKALNLFMNQRAFHPVRDFLNSVKWDGKPRVDTLLIDYFGADDTEYTRTVTRKTLIGAIKRVMKPGCVHDTVLVLISEKTAYTDGQGIGKSKFLRKLGKGWFSDSMTTWDGQKAYEQLNGNWIIEIPEDAVSRRTDVNQAKAFITSQCDRYREAYGYYVKDHPRQCIFVITANDRNILRDDTGGRRYWPVDLHPEKRKIDPRFDGFSDEDAEQVWAEAMQMYQNGETNYLSHEQEALAKAEQEDHLEDDSQLGELFQWLETPVPEDWTAWPTERRVSYFNGHTMDDPEKPKVLRNKICPAEILKEFKQNRNYKNWEAAEANKLMKQISGWLPYGKPTRFGIYGPQRGYYRVGSPEDPKVSANS